MLQNLWNPFRDWNIRIAQIIEEEYRYKTSETLLGIETSGLKKYDQKKGSYKTSETLLGIETHSRGLKPWQSKKLQNLWNPFRDWNQDRLSGRTWLLSYKTSETLLGIETQVVYEIR